MFILKINMIKAYVVDDLFDILALTEILNSTFNVLFILFFLIDRIFYKLIVIQYNNNDSYYHVCNMIYKIAIKVL